MKTITNYLSKHSALALFASMFLFASCSKQTAYVSQYDKLAYEQTVLPAANTEEIAKIPAEVAGVQNPTEMAVAPMLNTKAIDTKAIAGKKQSKTTTAFNNVKEKAPKAFKKMSVENLAGVSLLASATKGKVGKKIEGSSYLKIGIVLILIGALLSFIGLGWIGWL
ncbi:MAG: hypothetical protein ACXWEY_14865, partial [Bacteroidia bacterium]